MPVFQYVCPACGKKFDELVRKFDDPVRCPACGAEGELIGESGTVTPPDANDYEDTSD